jgi:hypothetical protein
MFILALFFPAFAGMTKGFRRNDEMRYEVRGTKSDGLRLRTSYFIPRTYSTLTPTLRALRPETPCNSSNSRYSRSSRRMFSPWR